MVGTKLALSSGWSWETGVRARTSRHQSFSSRQQSKQNRFDGAAALTRLFGGEPDFIQKKFGARHFAELSALAGEGDAEIFFAGLMNLGQRLQNRGAPELASEVYSAIVGAGQVAVVTSPVARRSAPRHGGHCLDDLGPSSHGRARGRTQGPPLQVAALAQNKLNAILGKGSAGLRAEILLKNFAAASTDSNMIIPMLAGSVVAQTVRAATLGRLAGSTRAAWMTRGMGARFTAGFAAYAAEVPVFALTGRWLGGSQGQTLGSDLQRAAVTLGALRVFGIAGNQVFLKLHGGGELSTLARFHRIFLPQASIFLGLLSAHRLEELAGLRLEADGATVVSDTLAAMLSLSAGGHLGRALLGKSLSGLASAPHSSPREWKFQPELLPAGGMTLPVRQNRSGPPVPISMAMGIFGGGKNSAGGGFPSVEKKLNSVLGGQPGKREYYYVEHRRVKQALRLLREAENFRVAELSPELRRDLPDLARQAGIHPELFLARYLARASGYEVEAWMEAIFGNNLEKRLKWIQYGKVRAGAKLITDILRLPHIIPSGYAEMFRSLTEMDASESLSALRRIAKGFNSNNPVLQNLEYEAVKAALHFEGGGGEMEAALRRVIGLKPGPGIETELFNHPSLWHLQWDARRALVEMELRQGRDPQHILTLLLDGKPVDELLHSPEAETHLRHSIPLLGKLKARDTLVEWWERTVDPKHPYVPIAFARAVLESGRGELMRPLVPHWMEQLKQKNSSFAFELPYILAGLGHREPILELLHREESDWRNNPIGRLQIAKAFDLLGEAESARPLAREVLNHYYYGYEAAALLDRLSPGWDQFIAGLRGQVSAPYR